MTTVRLRRMIIDELALAGHAAAYAEARASGVTDAEAAVRLHYCRAWRASVERIAMAAGVTVPDSTPAQSSPVETHDPT